MNRFGIPVERCNGGRPIIEPTDRWWETGVTFNAAAIYLERSPANEPIIRALLPGYSPDDPDLAEGVVAIHYRARPERDPQRAFVPSYIGLAVFTPDFKQLYRSPEPVLAPTEAPDSCDCLGVEDPRITRFGDTFYMVYCCLTPDRVGHWQARLCTATSHDLVRWQKRGLMAGDPACMDNKDGVLFPDRMNGRYYLLHRPFGPQLPLRDYAIHLAHSDTLAGPWQDYGRVLGAPDWPGYRASWVGAGSVPIRIDETRYIEIYHTGNYLNDVDREYDMDVAVFDFGAFDPRQPESIVTARLEHLMVPETPAELRSHSQLQVGNVLFPCGSYEYRGDIFIIYGGADTYTLAARVNKADLLSALHLDNPDSAPGSVSVLDAQSLPDMIYS
jgi:predicted GH43/DUF377 family glycosyl hydrolase